MDKRQSTTTVDPSYDPYDDSWWYSQTAEIVKYTVIVAIIVIIFLWVFGGSMHARRRIAQGKPLLWYHRWLVSRRNYSHADPHQPYYGNMGGQPGQQYQMQNWNYPAPPPAYGHDAPPAYNPPPGPPPGASKADPAQTITTQPVPAEQESGLVDSGSSVQRPEATHSASPAR